jgi:hypothetical protein
MMHLIYYRDTGEIAPLCGFTEWQEFAHSVTHIAWASDRLIGQPGICAMCRIEWTSVADDCEEWVRHA